MDPTDVPVVLPRTGDTVDRHVVVGEIARGGMAAVFAVRRTGAYGIEKLLAVKMILPHLAAESHFVQMFLDEARLASQIDHPNVCRVLDVGTHRDVPYLLMELVNGRSFAAIDAAARAESVEPRDLAAFWLSALAQAADGLHGAHEACGADGEPLGIVHRDVSPQNFLMSFDGRVRVVDFGIAAGRGRLVGTRTGEIKGKLAYLAPEQIQRDQAIGRATDLWGLGVVAWEVLSGKRLFADAEEAKVLWSVMSARIPDLAKEAPHLPLQAVETIMRCLQRDATQRPLDARAVSRSFAEAATEISRGGSSAQAGAGASAEQTMTRLFPEARPPWSTGVTADAPPRSTPARAKSAIDTGETATVALPLPAAPPRSRGVRWLAPTVALVAAALAGAAISRSSSTPTPTIEERRADASSASSAAATSSDPAASATNASPPAPSTSAPASPPGKLVGPRTPVTPRPPPSGRGAGEKPGALMSNPF